MKNTPELAARHAIYILRECRDMLMGAGDGGIFTQAIDRVTQDAVETGDYAYLTGLTARVGVLCTQWLDEWADHNSQIAGFYTGITTILDEQDSRLALDGLRLCAAQALVAFDVDRLRRMYERLAGPGFDL